MSSSALPSPTGDGQKFYDELINKYQLFKTRNSSNISIENDLNSPCDDKSDKNLVSKNDDLTDTQTSDVFIVEPDDQLLIEFDDNGLNICEKLVKLKDYLKAEIDKENKLRNGTEDLRKVSKDQNILQHLNCILKQSNYRLNNLKRDLQELNSHIQLCNNSGQEQLPSKLLNEKKRLKIVIRKLIESGCVIKKFVLSDTSFLALIITQKEIT